ncbi:hypothetical protein U1Q18_000727 [Sarracenia purpurea var. burkii]
MSFLNSQNQKHNPSKHNKKRLTKDQVRLLEISFSSNKRLEPDRKLQLAHELGVPPRQIAIWYQNKRARWKTQTLELDHSALQLRLETSAAEKRRLEKEVERLQGELDKAHKVVFSLKQPPSPPAPPPPPPPPLPLLVSSSPSTCCDDEGGSFGFRDQGLMSCSWVNSEAAALQLQELYACLMGAETDGSSCS